MPFGFATGNEDIDTLDIVAHDHYRELVDEIKSSDIFRYRDLDKSGVEPTDSVDVTSAADEGQLTLFDMVLTDNGVKTFADIEDPKTQDELYSSYLKIFGTARSHNQDKGDDSAQMTLFPTMGDDSANAVPENEPAQGVEEKKKKPASKEVFVQKLREYSAKAISVPKILVQTTSTVTFHTFEVKRTIQDFEVAKAKIERFDAINQQLLTSVDAQILEVDDAMNTLACMLLDLVSELSWDDADLIIDLVGQYLAQIEGDDEQKRKIVRRYATLIVDDLRKQLYEHMDRQIYDVHIVQKDLGLV